VFTGHKSLKYIFTQKDLNIRQRSRCPINYNLGKANDLADALSRKVMMARLEVQEGQLVQEMLEQGAKVQGERIHVSNLKLTPDLRQEIEVA
jgi:hypothetical protein